MDKKTTATIAMLILISLILLGCASQQRTIVSQKGAAQTTQEATDKTPEEVLVKEIEGGKLVEVYDDYVRMAPGEIKKNWMIINNVKDYDEEFMIIPCGGCDFEERVHEIGAGEYKIIKFKVRAMEGQKEIKVKDHLNNAYGFAQISIIVE
ncbi:hypothetical protein JW898_04465 [Candidatus Woesearchaeota archaeon]|nr:hypothetical protein [Candidatus Woesearchaeota archaeon]